MSVRLDTLNDGIRLVGAIIVGLIGILAGFVMVGEPFVRIAAWFREASSLALLAFHAGGDEVLPGAIGAVAASRYAALSGELLAGFQG